MAVTRIRNNQIQDSGIWANAKIIPGSITGTLMSSNLVITSDFVVTGNLFVTGVASYTTIASTNTFVNDPLIVFNNAFTGTNTRDIGIVMNRGSDASVAFFWDESADEFVFAVTTDDGTTYGNLPFSTLSNVRMGNLILNNYENTRVLFAGAAGLVSRSPGFTFASNVLTVGGEITITGASATIGTTTADQDLVLAPNGDGMIDANATNLTNLADPTADSDAVTLSYLESSLSSDVTGIVADNTVIRVIDNGTNAGLFLGNVDNQQVMRSTANSFSLFGQGYAQTTPIFNVTKAGPNANVATVRGAIVATGNVMGGYASFAALNNTPIGNVTASGAKFTDIDASGYTNLAGNLSAATAHFGTATASGYVNLAGNISAAIGHFGTLTTSGYLNLSGNLSAAVIHAGALTATGTTTLAATNVSGFLNSSGNISAAIMKTGALTATGTSTLGAVNASGYVNLAGNISTPILNAGAVNATGVVTLTNGTNATNPTSGGLIVSGGAGFAQDVWIAGNLYASNVISTTYSVITVQDPLVFFEANATYPYDYDIGFFSKYIGGYANVTVGTSFFRDDTDHFWKLVSNVTTIAGEQISLTGAFFDGLKIGNLDVADSTATTNFATGAIRSVGGISTGGQLRAGHGIQGTVIGNISSAAGTFTTITASGFVNTGGNVSAAIMNTGALNVSGITTLAATNVSGFLNSSGNISAAVVNGGAINSTGLINTTGNVSGAVVNAGALNATGTTTLAVTNVSGFLNSSANVSAAIMNTGALNVSGITTQTGFLNAAANISASGMNTATLNVSGITTQTGFLNAAGNISAVQVNAKTLTATGNIIGGQSSFASINSTPVGNATASSGAFTTLASSGLTTFTNATDATTLSAASVIASGGLAVTANTVLGRGLVVNSTGAAGNLHVRGAGVSNSLVYVDFEKNAMVFGGANLNVQSGVVTKFNSTGAIQVPVGTNAQRPGASGNADVAGLVRFNTASAALEFYDGSTWTVAGSEFTVIASQTFTGNGIATGYTMAASSTTAATIVAINGIVQIPTTAYAVSGVTLTFTEAPAPGDVIDTRRLTTTSSVTSLSSADGYAVVDLATSPYANISSGTSSAITRLSLSGADGDFGLVNGTPITYNQTAVNAPTGHMVAIDTFTKGKYTTAEYTISVRNGAQHVQSMKALLFCDGGTPGNVILNTYSDIKSAASLGNIAANLQGTTSTLFFIPANGTINPNVKVQSTYIV